MAFSCRHRKQYISADIIVALTRHQPAILVGSDFCVYGKAYGTSLSLAVCIPSPLPRRYRGEPPTAHLCAVALKACEALEHKFSTRTIPYTSAVTRQDARVGRGGIASTRGKAALEPSGALRGLGCGFEAKGGENDP